MGTPDNVPEPTGPPEPVTDGGSANGAGPSVGGTLAHLGELGTVVAVAGGLGFVIIGGLMSRPAHGATRSARIVWQERQAKIEQAVAETEEPGPEGVASPAGGVQ